MRLRSLPPLICPAPHKAWPADYLPKSVTQGQIPASLPSLLGLLVPAYKVTLLLDVFLKLDTKICKVVNCC